MSIYTPPTLNAVDFAVESFTPADLTPAGQALTSYTPPALSAVDFALTTYTLPVYPDVGWELLPGGGSPVNYALVCAAGSYTYSGQAATLTLARKLSLAAGAYTYTGQAATLAYTPGVTAVDYTLTCDAGAYTYSGLAATLTVARRLPLAAGAYTYTGQAATLAVARTLVCDAGAYTCTGQAATLAVARTLVCDAGAYTYTGQSATLTHGRSSGRASIRPIRDGYGTTAGVEARGEVGTPLVRVSRVAYRAALVLSGGAFAAGTHSHGEVGVIGGGSAAHAIPGNLRQVRGSVGTPFGYGAGCGAVEGVEAASEYGDAVTCGGGCAQVQGYESDGEVGVVSGGGILNPSDAEVLALIMAIRNRRKKLLTAA